MKWQNESKSLKSEDKERLMKTNSEALKKARILPRMELLEAGILTLQEDLKRATEKRKQPAQTPKSADVVGANKSAE